MQKIITEQDLAPLNILFIKLGSKKGTPQYYENIQSRSPAMLGVSYPASITFLLGETAADNNKPFVVQF